MKRVFLISILVVILSLSAVSASQNLTDVQDLSEDASIDVLIDDVDDVEVLSDENSQKEDLNITIDYPDEVVKMEYEYLPSIYLNNVPNDYPLGSYDVYVDGVFEKTINWNSYNENNDFAIDINKFDYGNHTISLNLPDTERYNPLNLTHDFKVVGAIITVPDEVVRNVNAYVNLVANLDATGNLIVNVNGTEFKKVALASDGHKKYAYVDLSGLNLGYYEIEAIYTGDGNFNRTSKKKIVPVSFDFSAEIYYVHYGEEDNRIEIWNLPRDIEHVPIVTINGINFNVTKSASGEYYVVNTQYAPIGENNIVVTYPGDKKYPARSINLTNTVYSVVKYKTYEDSNESAVYLRLPEGAQGNLTVLANGTLFKSKSVSDGEAKIDLDLPFNKYVIVAFYTGQDYNVINQTLYNFVSIPKLIYNDKMTYGEKQILYIEMTPNSTGNLSVYRNNQYIPIKIVNGKGNYTIDANYVDFWDDIEQSYIYLSFNYEDDSGFKYQFGRYVYIKPLPYKLSAKDVSGLYGNVITYSVKVWGGKGKPVEYESVDIKIGSKLYTVMTDANGVINLKIGSNVKYMQYDPKHNGYSEVTIKLSPGTYKITANYKGTKITTKLVIKPAKNVLVLYKASVKKSAKKLTLKAKLTINGKVANGKKITFKFKAKKYTAKTNKKGIAKVTIKKNVLNKLKVGKKVQYQATYAKVTKKLSVKVKK